MTRDEALKKLLQAPQHCLLYRGSGFGNRLAANLAANGIITFEREGEPKQTMTLTDWGKVLAKEV